MVAHLMSLPPRQRRDIVTGLSRGDLTAVLAAAGRELGTPYGLWIDDPAGFIEDVLGENMWSIPRAVVNAVHQNREVAVPSCPGASKTHTVSRLTLWHSCVHPVGTALTVTLAPRWRQVYRQIWPEVRAAHARSGMPGWVDMAQMKIRDESGMDRVVAYGMPIDPDDETSVQGIHAPNLLVIVDEAGGIPWTIGRALQSITTGSGTRMIAIGNPPTDEEGTWFEALCRRETVQTIPITADATPNLSGERVGRCRSCPAAVPAHPLSEHLTNRTWVQEVIEENGLDSAYVQARVFARFPKGTRSQTIPSSWLDAAVEREEPQAGPGWWRLDELGLVEETAAWMVQEGAYVRLGVDVAAGGGDELVIARQVGDLGMIMEFSSGETNSDAVVVAGKILAQIRRAEALARRLGTAAPVRVKIDAIGLGWGVASTLSAWGREGRHGAQIVPVNVAEAVHREPDSTSMIPDSKRDEMWLAGRALVRPAKEFDGEPMVRLRVDKRTMAQLRGPQYGTTSGGKVRIEAKTSMRARGLRSPDRAEAWLLAVYEPSEVKRKRPKARLIA